ncbi:MAG: glycosyltransferase [Clostridia bacterium]|nr:glycosyltransferase [Clostridia bacterium]
MNICFVTGALKYSGAEKIITNLMRQLQQRGHKISVIEFSLKEPAEGFDGIDQYPVNSGGRSIKNIYNRLKKVRRVVKNNKFDVVLSFNSVYNLDMVPAMAFLKTPLVLCERNDPNYDPRTKLKKLRKKISYPFATGYIFQTERIKNYFSKGIGKRSEIIPNFIEEPYECVTDNERRKVIVTCARLDDRQKNQSMLIRAFSRFAKENDEYNLEFYGSGPDKAKYESLIKELGMEKRIILCGRVEDVQNRLKNAEIFVLPSVFEGMPNALIEAMGMGLPCIATDCGGGGSAALIENDVNGILIDNFDEDALYEAFKRLCADGVLRKKLGHNAYKVNETLEISKIIDLWEKAAKRFSGN